MLMDSPSTRNCSRAAGREASSEASKTLRSLFLRNFASFALVVVLPTPCKPTIKITAGRLPSRRKRLEVAGSPPPSASTKTSYTIFATCCPGVTDSSKSLPIARSDTLPRISFTIEAATSASKSASPSERTAAATSSGVRTPRPRSRSNIPPSLSPKSLNINWSRLCGALQMKFRTSNPLRQ